MDKRAKQVVQLIKAAVEADTWPDSGRAYWHDDEITGLALCVKASCAESSNLVRRVTAKSERCHLGKCPKTNVDAPWRAATKPNGKVAGGENPNDERCLDYGATTLSEMLKPPPELPTCRRKRLKRSVATVEGYRWQFTKYLKACGERRIVQTCRHYAEQPNARVGHANGRYAANRALSQLRAILKHTLNRNLTERNPPRDVRPFSKEHRDRFKQADETVVRPTMTHADSTIPATYRERSPDAILERIAEHVPT